MTNEHQDNGQKNDAGISELLGSVVGLATAGTKFTSSKCKTPFAFSPSLRA